MKKTRKLLLDIFNIENIQDIINPLPAELFFRRFSGHSIR